MTSFHRPSRFSTAALAAALTMAGVARAAAPVLSDVFPPSRRQTTMDLAQRLSSMRDPGKLPEKLVSPFNPPSFDALDPEEARLAAEAAEAARRAGLGQVKPTNNRELLAAIAAQLKPTGMVQLGGHPILILDNRKLRVGDHLNAEYNGSQITVTVTAIDRNSFTLRLQSEELTRPIKSN